MSGTYQIVQLHAHCFAVEDEEGYRGPVFHDVYRQFPGFVSVATAKDQALDYANFCNRQATLLQN